MNLTDLQTLLDYHYWARDRVLDAIEPLTPEQYVKDLGSSFPSVRDTAAHLHAAEWAWHSRWMGHSPTALLPADRFADVGALRSAWSELESRVREFVGRDGDAGVDRVYEFTLLSGAAASATLGQMVQHVVNHASYHRGQLTTMLRQLGAAPGKPMDLIAFYRVRRRDG
jgi:uncharacterized damage-inducible protein DinB